MGHGQGAAMKLIGRELIVVLFLLVGIEAIASSRLS